MKLLAGAAVLLATATLFGGCVADDAAQGGGGSAEGSGDVGSTTAPATGPTTSVSTGGNEGGGGGADECPRARIEVPGGEILNVRPDPSTQNPPVGTLPNGAIVDVVEQVTGEVIEGNDVWLSIQSGSLAGYVSAAFAVCTTEEPPEPPDGYYVPLA